MTARVDREKTVLQTFDRNFTLRSPVRDVSLADFNRVVQASIYANRILVTSPRKDVA